MKLKIYLMDVSNVREDVLLSSPYISLLEKESFNKYKDEVTRKEKIASSILKNKYVGAYHLNEYGKPISDEKCFNISHSHEMVALVLDIVDVGIDIEKIRPVEEDLKNYISSEEEKKFIRNDENFFEIWTNKEALVKAAGTGVREKVKDIRSLPLNNLKEYKGELYYNKTTRYKDFIITVSRKSSEDFSLDIILEVI